jgi:addiction module HigA family antidote
MIRLPTNRAPTPPGEILQRDFLAPLGLTQTELATRMKVPIQRVNQICRARRAITPDTALRLAKLFSTSPEFWLNAQIAWDLWHATHSDKAEEIDQLEPVRASA